MPQQGRRNVDDTLLRALACGATHEVAAHQAGISKRTVERRMKEPEFRARLNELCSDMLKRFARTLTAASGEAIKTLLALLQPTNSQATRLGAARTILELGPKLRETAEFEERLAALEQQMTLNNKNA
jgi:primosomal protein N''